jgi:ABC-type glycerol-3-phosphate transport system permease component
VRSRSVARFVASLACFVIGGIYILPLLWTVSLSFRKSSEVFGVILQHTFEPGNYVRAWKTCTSPGSSGTHCSSPH